ncbi:hypothetical protein [Fusobacterium ulcerans]|uniref:hypothetical protein n=1 Tax=Fusobacterium ulcerans TaxID=861 RepID=UPI002E7898E0|nr:hypothetical protein [Fusobacterium ulcerans]MEE0137961.1 hypothetical protein [Fusobacterium ulcerans]
MKNLKSIINDLNLIDENDEVFKEALELLLDFSNLKISVMEKGIKENLISGTFIGSDFKVPISHILSTYSGQIVKNSENENTIINNVFTSLTEAFHCNKDMIDSIMKNIEKKLIEFMQGEDKEIKFSFLALEGMSIVRYDLTFYIKSLNSKKIREKVQCNLPYVIVKSSVNVRQLPFNDFSALCIEVLTKYFGEDHNKIRTNLAEMRDAYSISNLS